MELYLVSIRLKLEATKGIILSLTSSIQYSKPLIPVEHEFTITYRKTDTKTDFSNYRLLLKGLSEDYNQVPYDWQILSNKRKIIFHISYVNEESFLEAHAEIQHANNQIAIFINPKAQSTDLKIDPLFHPLGSLLMVYFANISNSFLIHASGVSLHNKGYLFTAKSGTGKSTIANLWQNAGATIINDDRLWIKKIENRWVMLNTPMLYYIQSPKLGVITKVFLIQQSPVNELHSLSGLKAAMRLLSNCIQHLHSEEYANKHLDRILEFASNTSIYDCGFIPDQEIVKMMLALP